MTIALRRQVHFPARVVLPSGLSLPPEGSILLLLVVGPDMTTELWHEQTVFCTVELLLERGTTLAIVGWVCVETESLVGRFTAEVCMT